MKSKYLMVYMNEIRFDQSLYGTESIIKESRLDFIRISTEVAAEFPY